MRAFTVIEKRNSQNDNNLVKYNNLRTYIMLWECSMDLRESKISKWHTISLTYTQQPTNESRNRRRRKTLRMKIAHQLNANSSMYFSIIIFWQFRVSTIRPNCEIGCIGNGFGFSHVLRACVFVVLINGNGTQYEVKTNVGNTKTYKWFKIYTQIQWKYFL